jgi:beta-RFAP synthase
MMRYQLHVKAGSRLHLGLLGWGQEGKREFGGVGLMLQSPSLVLLAEPSMEWTFSGRHAERIGEFAARWRQAYPHALLRGCHLRLLRSPPQHVGLGTGTQLGLAVAAALYQLHQQPLPPPEQLAAVVGRGHRSSIGTFGFLLGGLIVDQGKLPGDPLGALAAHVDLPPAWRVVLLRPPRRRGLSGMEERRAFEALPQIPSSVSERLWRCVEERLLPAARAGDVDGFGEAVYEYGHEAGMCFTALQGGPYASPLLAEWVAALRRRGIKGVGQSSWGPTLFALLPDRAAAEELVDWARRDLAQRDQLGLRIARIARHGARIGGVNAATGSES